MTKTIPVKEVAMAVVVNPSKTSTLGSCTTHVAVLHHIAGGKLVEMSRERWTLGSATTRTRKRRMSKIGCIMHIVARDYVLKGDCASGVL